MESLTDTLNNRNIENIRYQINLKKENFPYYGTSLNNRNVITDYDTFPYPRYFRGEPNSDNPIISEREAGWRPRNEDCYDDNYKRVNTQGKHHDVVNPKHFFQPPCSTVYPKYVSENDISLTDVKLNENCVISYR